MSVTLNSPVVNVALEAADGTRTTHTVETDNRDLVRWDLTRTKRQWPDGQTAPMLWLTFIAWAALDRTGQVAEPFDTFQPRCLAVEVVKADDGTEATSADDPTVAPSVI